ncbi:MAG: FAD-binding oxidoreductase [Nitrososphaerota archaeon]|jgi:glycine/D-amino acid oxidase-like deaminating enzyme|nr:FAD-binding oxidoreductase [Nitrososphaerota archaeon]
MQDYDIVVVGAGILGISSAYHLKANNPDKTVLVVEMLGDVGQGNTGRSNAMFRNMFTSKENRELADSAIDFYSHIQHDLKRDVGVDKIGYLWLMSEKQLSASERHLRRMENSGVEVRRMGESELKSRIPGIETNQDSDEARVMSLEDVTAGLFGPKCGRLAPDRLASFYRDGFVAKGGVMLFNRRVARLLIRPRESTGFDGEPFVWQESGVSGVGLADGETIGAGTVVVACGAWNNELLDPIGIDGHAKAKKRQLFAVPVGTDASLKELLFARGFNESGTLPFLILPKSGLFVKPVKESNEFWVGCEDEFNRPFISYPEHDLEKYPAEPKYYEYNLHQVLREYLPQFERSRPDRMWGGLYSYNTLDNMPYVFGHEGLIVVGGDSGSGVMKGDSLGRIVDAFYRGGEGSEVTLYGGRPFKTSKLGFRRRDVEREDWIL